MDLLHPLAGLMRPVLAVTVSSWWQQLDGASVVIGLVTLVFGLLGLAYLAAAFVLTPQPPGLAEAPEPYPSVDRFLVPFALPVGVALVVATIIFLVSQILLVVPEAVATPIALFLALAVLVICSALATMRRVSRGLIYTAIGVPALILVLAGGVAGIYRLTRPAPPEVQTPVTAATETTTDNKFSLNSITVPAGQAVTLTVDNKGLAQHNWHVLEVKASDGSDIMTDLAPPGQSSKVSFTLADAGQYKFQCDVHPQEMIGTLKVQAQ